MTPDILFDNKILLIIIACLRYFSRTEDLKRFVSVWSCEKFCSFVFSLLSGQEKGFDKTLCVSLRTYGGLNHIMFAKKFHKFSDKIVKV